ncbi:MAG: hypothetical protein KJZ78_18610 [Bryobacteraceae bacterium]|nr:hypothetical protein [Bryobacteraceae bacterium]
MIQVTRRGNAEGGRSTNEYRFLFHEMFEGSYRQDIAGEGEEGNRQDTAAKVGELPAGYGEVTGRIALGNRQDIAGSYKEDELRNELRNELHNTRSPKVSKREADSLVEKWFAEFWETYPRKVGKAAALRIAGKVAKFPKDREAIMAGLTRQLPELQSREPQYIPHAATWLNQRRWEDEPESPTQALTVRGPYEDKWAARDRGRNEMFRDLIGSRLKNGEIQ